MTKKEKDGLMDLISNFNSINQEHDVLYSCSAGLLCQDTDNYFLSLRLNTLIFSPDFAEIMSQCVKHDILCNIQHFHDFTVLFFY